jgi:hypothetical protein
MEYSDGPNLYEYLLGAPNEYVDPLGWAVGCGKAKQCFINCLRFFMKCQGCASADPSCGSNLPNCLSGCKASGFTRNPVILTNCPPRPAPPPPPKCPEVESPAKTMASHLAATAGEQAATLAAEQAGHEGAGAMIGPAATVAGAVEALPDTALSGIRTAAKKYFVAHNDIDDFACDPGYVGLLITTSNAADLPNLLQDMIKWAYAAARDDVATAG